MDAIMLFAGIVALIAALYAIDIVGKVVLKWL